MKQVNKKFFDVIEDDFSWVYQVDNIEEKDNKLWIKGWAFVLNEDASKETYEIILYDTKTGKSIYPNIAYELRKDVNEYFLCEYDYTDSGFVANISTRKLQLENTVYEILLRPEGERKAFSTNVYYSDGEISYVHSDEFVPLEVVGTDLEEIVEGMKKVDEKTPITSKDYVTILGYAVIMANIRMANLKLLDRTYEIYNNIIKLLNGLNY